MRQHIRYSIATIFIILTRILYVTLPIPISHCMEMNVFETTCPLIKNVRSSEGAVQTQEFLEVCRQILPVVGMYSIDNVLSRISPILGISIKHDRCSHHDGPIRN